MVGHSHDHVLHRPLPNVGNNLWDTSLRLFDRTPVPLPYVLSIHVCPLNKSNIDLLLYGFIKKDGYDFSVNISNQLTKQLIGGVMLGYEKYSENNDITFKKNNETKSFTVRNDYSGISSMIYLGFLLIH